MKQKTIKAASEIRARTITNIIAVSNPFHLSTSAFTDLLLLSNPIIFRSLLVSSLLVSSLLFSSRLFSFLFSSSLVSVHPHPVLPPHHGESVHRHGPRQPPPLRRGVGAEHHHDGEGAGGEGAGEGDEEMRR